MRLADGWLDRLEQELGGLAGDAARKPIDPAMVGGVITSAHKT
jgi:hypothetical protein